MMVKWSKPASSESAWWLLIPTALFIIGCGVYRPTDPDFWWHLRTGQVIFETGVVPTRDIFSFPSVNAPWVAHEWLSELLFYVTYTQFGYGVLSLLFGVLGAGIFFVLYHTGRIWGAGAQLSWCFAVCGFALTLIVGGVRPQGLTLFLEALTVCLLSYSDRKQRVWSLWFLVPIMVAWVNLHGGFVIGLATVGLWWISSLLSSPRTTMRLTVLLPILGAFLATLVSPHGLTALTYPFSYAGSDNASMRFLQEWQSPDFHSGQFLPLLLLLITTAVVGVVGRPLAPFYSSMLLLFMLLALRSGRHSALFGVVAGPILAARVSVGWQEVEQYFAKFSPRVIGIALSLGLCVIFGVCVDGRLTAALPHQYGREPDRAGCPTVLVEALKGRPVGQIFNEYSWGGYLIHELYPSWQVFIDGRADVHGDGHMSLYYDMWRGAPLWRAKLDEFQIRYVILAHESPLVALLLRDRAWQQLAADKFGVLLARDI